jgi:hypothetical protein
MQFWVNAIIGAIISLAGIAFGGLLDFSQLIA